MENILENSKDTFQVAATPKSDTFDEILNDKTQEVLERLALFAELLSCEYPNNNEALREINMPAQWDNVFDDLSFKIATLLQNLAEQAEPNYGWKRGKFSATGTQVIYRPARDDIKSIREELVGIKKEFYRSNEEQGNSLAVGLTF